MGPEFYNANIESAKMLQGPPRGIFNGVPFWDCLLPLTTLVKKISCFDPQNKPRFYNKATNVRLCALSQRYCPHPSIGHMSIAYLILNLKKTQSPRSLPPTIRNSNVLTRFCLRDRAVLRDLHLPKENRLFLLTPDIGTSKEWETPDTALDHLGERNINHH